MSRVVAKYILFQVPGAVGAVGVLWALVRWWELEPRIAALLFGLWVVKDIALFPVLRIGYESRGAGADAIMVGASGVAQEDLRPDCIGYVRVGAELWRARLDGGSAAAEIRQGARVRVTALQDLTLSVEALPDEAPEEGLDAAVSSSRSPER